MAEKKKKATPQDVRAESIAKLAVQIRTVGEAVVAGAEDAVARLADGNKRMSESLSNTGNADSPAFVIERQSRFLMKAAVVGAAGRIAAVRADELATVLHVLQESPALAEFLVLYGRQVLAQHAPKADPGGVVEP